MDLRALSIFIEVAELGSFTRAGEKLGYSQPTISFQIKQLEKEMGAQLFDRIGKTVSITQYGKDFVSYARDVVSAIARASAFASSDSELSGTVRVGTLNSLLTASFHSCPKPGSPRRLGATMTYPLAAIIWKFQR